MFAKKIFRILPLFFCMAVAAAPSADLEKFQPDFKTWDIYLPHMKRIPLSGWWKLKKVSSDRKNNPNDEGTKQKYHLPEFNDSDWGKDLVPNNLHAPFLNPNPSREEKTWGGIAWFRKEFQAPELKKGERAILYFNEVLGVFKVWVNGTLVGEQDFIMPTDYGDYKGPGDPLQYDITHLLRPGRKNIIAVRLFHTGEPVMWEIWSPYCGILGTVHLDVKPAAWSDRILVTPEANLRDVSFECLLSGSEKPEDTDLWNAEIFEWKSGRRAASFTLGKEYKKDGKRYVAGKTTLTNPKLWSPESPFLYGVKFRNRKGEVTGVQRFGMRTFGVKDGNFVLNGKPIMLRGICQGNEYPRNDHGYSFAMTTNEGNALRTYWKMYKDLNINHVRIHSSQYSSTGYDIMDELGFILTDELNYPTVRLKNTVRADEIDVKGFDGASDKNGKLLPQFIEKITSRIHRKYSHPSVCTFSFGNELRDYTPRATVMLNHLYDLYRRIDRQRRPITSSSGRFWKDGSNAETLCRTEKMDYVDTHDYTGSINNMPLAYCQPVAEDFIALIRKHFPGKSAPIVNGETVYFVQHYYPGVTDGVWPEENAPLPDWKKALYVLNDWHTKDPGTAFLALYWVRNWGMKNYKYHRDLGRGIYTDRILEIQRKLWPEMDGYEALSGPFFQMPKSAYPFDRLKFEPNEAYSYLKRVCAPQVVILDYVAPNRFTGEEVSTNAYLINNSERDVSHVVLEIGFEKDGIPPRKVLTRNIGTLKSNEKRVVPVSFPLPKQKGEYRLVYRFLADGKELNRRDSGLNLRNRAEIFAPLKTDKKIALYDASAVFGGLKPYNSTRVLKAFGLPFTSVTNFKDLRKFDVLILGNGSVDGKVHDGAEEIRKFVSDGGRLLVFDQTVSGRIPFLPELEYSLAGPGQFSEILQFNHPVLKGMTQKEFFCWNQKDWSVYRTYIRPVSEAALTVGGDTTQWGSDNFGMVNVHLKLGKGDIFLTQAEVTSTFRMDSGAALLTRGFLKALLDDATRKNASPFRGYDMKIKGLKSSSAEFISLKDAANMAFADETAKDGKGGWTDQGSINDLSPFPVGSRIFGGVPFRILDPKENAGRSCVMVSGNKTLPFQPESRKIQVGKQVKRLLFLHSGAWMDSGAGQIGEYEVQYGSGKKLTIPIVEGENITDWWGPSKKLTRAICGWSGMNQSGVVGVFLFSWDNPRPGDPVKHIVLKTKGDAVVGLVGLTAEKMEVNQ